jgi:hypothetical protein
MKKYEKLENTNIELKIELYYKKENERGYYISVSPVKREFQGNLIIETYTAYSGYKKLILPVKRQSDKGYNLALSEAPEWIDIIKDKVLSNIQVN